MIVTAAVLGLSMASGCKLLNLKKDVARLENRGLMGGHVSRPSGEDAPIIVVLTGAASTSVLDSFLLVERVDAYFFSVQPGTYRVAAFVDRNRDFVYQPEDEPAARFGAPSEIVIAAGQKRIDIDLKFDPRRAAKLDMAVDLRASSRPGSPGLPPLQLGEVVSIDDPRFSAQNGNLGLWQPVEFLFKIGAGFYFLEPFDAKKIPVVFVHGAGGHPDEFSYLIDHLDRTRFQPWLLYYPSGIDLETIARGIGRGLLALVVRHQVDSMAIVAHSLGGLVSRAAINNAVAVNGGKRLKLFVSISSPWNGYNAAAQGVEHSPVVMPMWRDMAPGSAFLDSLFGTPLPKTCPYYLLFSYAGSSMFLNEANDSVVALSSELVAAAQQAATKVYGFNETHTSILRSPAVSQTLNSILADQFD